VFPCHQAVLFDIGESWGIHIGTPRDALADIRSLAVSSSFCESAAFHLIVASGGGGWRRLD